MVESIQKEESRQHEIIEGRAKRAADKAAVKAARAWASTLSNVLMYDIPGILAGRSEGDFGIVGRNFGFVDLLDLCPQKILIC